MLRWKAAREQTFICRRSELLFHYSNNGISSDVDILLGKIMGKASDQLDKYIDSTDQC